MLFAFTCRTYALPQSLQRCFTLSNLGSATNLNLLLASVNSVCVIVPYQVSLRDSNNSKKTLRRVDEASLPGSSQAFDGLSVRSGRVHPATVTSAAVCVYKLLQGRKPAAAFSWCALGLPTRTGTGARALPGCFSASVTDRHHHLAYHPLIHNAP
jgi:hypothetical protein